jgi:hypothetical protein
MVTCRVLPRSTLETSPDLPALGPSAATQASVNFVPFNQFHTLPFSECCNSFICHSYGNTGGVPQLFPFWNSAPAPWLAPAQFPAVVVPLELRWSPVVFPREMLSISYFLISLPHSFFHNEGGYTHSPASLHFCLRTAFLLSSSTQGAIRQGAPSRTSAARREPTSLPTRAAKGSSPCQ